MQVLVRNYENLFVLVLAGEVDGLRGKVSDNVRPISPPETPKALLLVDAFDAIADSFVLFVGVEHLLGAILHLQKQLHPFDGGNGRLGEHARHPTEQKVFQEQQHLHPGNHRDALPRLLLPALTAARSERLPLPRSIYTIFYTPWPLPSVSVARRHSRFIALLTYLYACALFCCRSKVFYLSAPRAPI
jgi:hypothetical protein